MICEMSAIDSSNGKGLTYDVDALVPGNANLSTLRTEIYTNHAHLDGWGKVDSR